MKTDKYQLKDISNILAIPESTLRSRFFIIGLEPSTRIRDKCRRKDYYSKTQFEAVKRWFELNGHKKQSKPLGEPKMHFEIETNCIVIESKLNYELI